MPGAREWLFKYCESYFKEHRVGYYSDEDISWIPFSLEDLDAFVLTEKGLVLVFQDYRVGGLYGAPITLLLCYDKLVSAKLNSPLVALVEEISSANSN